MLITRRSVLGGATLGVVTVSLAGCRAAQQTDGTVVTTTDVGESIRQEVIAAETALVALYDQAIAGL
ncbi:MAG: hypothetical protein ACKOW5_10145, partial [Actinomycetales bacterium]